MFTDLNYLLDSSDKNPPLGLCTLISDYHTDSEFVLHHFISLSLRGNVWTCLVATEQTFSHFRAVAQKLGVNLGSCIADGQLVFIDAFSHLLDDVMGVQTSPDGDYAVFTLEKNSLSLRGLFGLVRSAAPEDDRPFCVLVENCSAFLHAGVTVGEVNSFAQNCQALTCAKRRGYFVARVRDNCDVDEGDDQMLVTLLCHRSHVHLKCSALQTGLSRHVHGLLSVKWRGDPARVLDRRRPVVYRHYKLLDRTVSFFASGTSAAVL